jgi:ubiquinone/menaquinone biosynthesis C-methylase UbiE
MSTQENVTLSRKALTNPAFRKVTRSFSQFKLKLPPQIYGKILDATELIEAPKNELVAPLRLRHKIGQDIEYNGNSFVQLLKTHCELKQDGKVLDVGCGCGRMALALAKYLSSEGSYKGTEIDKEFVDWCKRKISPRYPNFSFSHADIFSSSYNPKGKITAADYRFPFANDSFDVVFLSSVFTHMLPRDLKNYFTEVARVMKKNSRCLITYFLLNGESQEQMTSGKTTFNFIEIKGCSIVDKNFPENAVAYKEEYIIDLYNKLGLEIKQPIHYGGWAGKKSPFGLQDVIIARKTPC